MLRAIEAMGESNSSSSSSLVYDFLSNEDLLWSRLSPLLISPIMLESEDEGGGVYRVVGAMYGILIIELSSASEWS